MGDKRWKEEKLTKAKFPYIVESGTNEMAEHYGDRMAWTTSDCGWWILALNVVLYLKSIQTQHNSKILALLFASEGGFLVVTKLFFNTLFVCKKTVRKIISLIKIYILTFI